MEERLKRNDPHGQALQGSRNGRGVRLADG